MVPAPTTDRQSIVNAFAAAFQRAAAHKLVAYRLDRDTYAVPSASEPGVEYTVRHIGPAWYDWTCTCPAGQHGRTCQHTATAAYARKYSTGAVRPRTLQSPALAAARAQIAAEVAAGINPLDALFN